MSENVNGHDHLRFDKSIDPVTMWQHKIKFGQGK